MGCWLDNCTYSFCYSFMQWRMQGCTWVVMLRSDSTLANGLLFIYVVKDAYGQLCKLLKVHAVVMALGQLVISVNVSNSWNVLHNVLSLSLYYIVQSINTKIIISSLSVFFFFFFFAALHLLCCAVMALSSSSMLYFISFSILSETAV